MNSLYTIKEAAEILNVSTKTMYNLVKTGKVKAGKIGSTWRIKKEDLEEFLADSFNKSKS